MAIIYVLALITGFAVVVSFIFAASIYHSLSPQLQAIVPAGLILSFVNMVSLIIKGQHQAILSLASSTIALCCIGFVALRLNASAKQK